MTNCNLLRRETTHGPLMDDDTSTKGIFSIQRVNRKRRRRRLQSRCPLKGAFWWCGSAVVVLISSLIWRLPTTQSLSTTSKFTKTGRLFPSSHASSPSLLLQQQWSLSPSLLFGRRSHNCRSNTKRHMVLTTPESIIEQASTQKLLDDLIDESVRTSARRPIMLQFDPSSGWIWRRWTGTVFSETWRSCVKSMIYAAIILYIYRSHPTKIKDQLSGFNVLWGQLLQVTTFTLTFFLNQSYALWRKCYELSRRLQGRLQDIGMTLAAHAARKTPTNPKESSNYTTASRQLLELVSRYVRLFNLLTYASFTRSHRPILTPRGMRRLVERGLMTAQERQVLVSTSVPATQRHNAVLLWITRAFVEGRQQGHFVGGAGFEDQFLEKIHVTRAQYGSIGDELQGRMPLAYAHLVQILVDVILYMYPLMAYTSGMSPILVILGTGLLTMSYQGLFDLAKQFLDPYDNENYGNGDDPLCVDTLIAETNAGSIRWMNAFEEMPFSAQKIKDGDLFDYILPIRGYSVDEVQQQEQEKLQKDMAEQRERDRLDEEGQARVRSAELEQPAAVGAATTNNTAANESTTTSEAVQDEFNGPNESSSSAKFSTAVNNSSLPMEGTKKAHKVTALDSGVPVTLGSNERLKANNGVEQTAAETTPTQSTLTTKEVPVKGEKVRSSRKGMGNSLFTPPAKVVNGDSFHEKEPLESTKQVAENISKFQDHPTHDEIGRVNKDRKEESTKETDPSAFPDSAPTFDESQFESMSKLWGQAILAANILPNANVPPLLESLSSGVSHPRVEKQSDNDVSNEKAVPSKASGYPQSLEEVDKPRWSEGFVAPEEKGAKFSEKLADGFLEQQHQVTQMLVTLEDYNKQVAAILEAAKEEMLETEAILKAPPGAHSVFVPEKEDGREVIQAANTTTTVSEWTTSDDLAVLEMDVKYNRTDSDKAEPEPILESISRGNQTLSNESLNQESG